MIRYIAKEECFPINGNLTVLNTKAVYIIFSHIFKTGFLQVVKIPQNKNNTTADYLRGTIRGCDLDQVRMNHSLLGRITV